MFENFDPLRIRQDFPILSETLHGHPLIYFDNAATTQKPRAVIDAISNYYLTANANVHRSVHGLGAKATELFEKARIKIAAFIHAPEAKECIFVRGTTEGINLVAQSFVGPKLAPGDEILITQMEHHSNLVPWQMLCEKTQAQLAVIPISEQGEILLQAFVDKLKPNTKFIALSYASNAIGSINPVKEMITLAKARGIPVLLDAAQAVPHLPVDVQDLGCDFLAFSGHKLYGPTGIGVLWGKREHLDRMNPYQGGGEMITQVSFAKTLYAPLPYKFEAGTPDIAGVIGLAAAIDYLKSHDFTTLERYEQFLLDYATEALARLPGFHILGQAKHKVPLVSFYHEKIHAHDLGTILDSEGIAARSGHHCAMPLMDFFHLPASTRLSFAFYNTIEEIDTCMATLAKANEIFR